MWEKTWCVISTTYFELENKLNEAEKNGHKIQYILTLDRNDKDDVVIVTKK